MTAKFRDLFTPYETRTGILKHLSAWDIAKLNYCLGLRLDGRERDLYLNPIRDLFHNTQELHTLLSIGMRLILIGKDSLRLYERLQDPESYLRQTGVKKRLQIYLLGAFSVESRSKYFLKKFLGFCATKELDANRAKYDEAVFKVIDGQNVSQMFLMSFGVPFRNGRVEERGFWHLHTGTPDASIDLRIYVPCFRDRLLGEVTVRPSVLLGMFGESSNLRTLRTAWVFLRVYIKRFTLERGVYYIENGVQKTPERSHLAVRFLHTKSIVGI